MESFIFIAIITSPLWLRILVRMWREERYFRRMERIFRNSQNHSDHNDKTD